MKHLCIIKIMIIILLTSFTTSSYAQMGISSRAFVEILGIKTGYGTEGWFFEFEPEIATKLGVFGFSTTFERKTSSQRRVSSKEKIIYAPEKDFILTIRKDGKDHIYAIHGYEEIGFTTTGTSSFTVGKHSLFIDLTHADIHGLKLKGKKYSDSHFDELREANKTGTFTDERDDHVYKWVKIGDQVWMAENLAYKTNNASCAYDDNESNVAIYGRFYSKYLVFSDFNICPNGWHVPSENEWKKLLNYLGDPRTQGKKLKSKSILWDENTGTDEVGFSVQPSGICINGGIKMGKAARFLSSTRTIDSDGKYNYPYLSFDDFLSVALILTDCDMTFHKKCIRCIKD